MTENELLLLDQQHLWHPYSSINSPVPVFAVKEASGVYLTLLDGRKILDGMSSWWSAIHGYNHPTLNNAVTNQLSSMAHVMFGGLTHEPAVRLAETLVKITPANLDHVFISDSGSVAMEVAMKMALQYWQAKSQAQRNTFLSFKHGYHGDTFGAMSICDPVNGMHHLFSENLKQNIFAEAPPQGFDLPWDSSQFENFKTLLNTHQENIAAVVLEPIVQGAGGMRFYSPKFLQQIRALCDEHGILLIADEIATGFGRTGKLFACEHANISPDILALGKALTGGYMSLAATLCSNDVAHAICSAEPGVFMHGPTFMGNPLACSVANASIDLLLQSDWESNIHRIESALQRGLDQCSHLKAVKDIRVLGAIGVIELAAPVDMKTIQPMFVDHDIWVRPFGKLVYVMPPYICTTDEIAFLCERICKVLQKYLNH